MADVFVGDKATVTPVAADKLLVMQGGALRQATIASAVGAGTLTQSGTGAEARTVQDWMRDRVSVMDFIPESQKVAIRAGTSTYDCQPAFQAAWAAAGAVGKRVHIPDGGYRLASSWVLNHPATTPGEVSGESKFGTKLLPDDGITAIRFTSTSP